MHSSGSALLAKIKQYSGGRNTLFYINFDRQSFTKLNGQSHYYCINMYGIIHQNEKGLTNKKKLVLQTKNLELLPFRIDVRACLRSEEVFVYMCLDSFVYTCLNVFIL